MVTRNELKNAPWEMSDRQRGRPAPPLQKPYPEGAELRPLVPPDEIVVPDVSLRAAIGNRRSRRKYSEEPLSWHELSFLLWATQGVQRLGREGTVTFRTVPAGGALHPYETYLLVSRVEGLAPGLYRYLALEHAQLHVGDPGPGAPEELGSICNGQPFVGTGAVVFLWTVRPYRHEWRYGPRNHKDTLISAGHLCQNLYLACEAIGAGTCAVVAYEQDRLDRFLGVDGDEEIALYLAPVGKIAPTRPGRQ